jgi:putative endonuclease
MFYVYMLKSQTVQNQRYVGYTTYLRARLASHNRGENRHTSKYLPWDLETYIAFKDEVLAKNFEQYLKTGSGQAFANKRLWPH